MKFLRQIIKSRKPRDDQKPTGAATEDITDTSTGVTTKTVTVTLAASDLAEHVLFASLSRQELLPYLRACSVRILEDGETLLQRGVENRDMYLILSGYCRVLLPFDTRHSITKLGPGQSVGEISFIDHKPATAQVVAKGKTRVLRMSAQVCRQLIEDHPQVAWNLMLMLASRIRNSDALLSAFKGTAALHRHNAHVDPLTCLHNRRWLAVMLPRIMQRHIQNSNPLSILMIDVDHFKSFNDTHGHPAGDAALQKVAEVLTAKLRPEDIIIRYGGEEILAVLPCTDTQEAWQVAERLRIAIQRTTIALPGQNREAKLTISIGLAGMQAKQTPKQLVTAADKALYQAKEGGRDQTRGQHLAPSAP